MSPKSPRQGSERVGGIPWMARMIDKARLEAAGEIDVYDLDFPCPMDMSLLTKLNIDAKRFQEIAVKHDNDEAILEALEQAGATLATAKA